MNLRSEKVQKFSETCSTCGNIRFLMLETKSMALPRKLFLIISIFKMTPRYKNICFSCRETWVREPIWINNKSNLWKFWFIKILLKKMKKPFFNQIFQPKWNASSQILMRESSQVSLSNKSLIIDISQIYKQFLESLDYQDFHSRIPQKDFIIDC